MREILFRAKRKDNGEWAYGYLYGIWEQRYICWWMTNNVPEMREVIPETVSQYTGLTDKNGNKIWENDVVNCPSEECYGKISWNESESGFFFCILLEDGRFDEEHIYDYVDDLEVIGNVFDNADLLEVK